MAADAFSPSATRTWATTRNVPGGVLEAVALPAEQTMLRNLARSHSSVHWDRLLFSAKESVYKARFPLTGKWLDFLEADIEIAPGATTEASGSFRARLLVPGPLVDGHRIESFDGHWNAHRDLLATAVVVHHF